MPESDPINPTLFDLAPTSAGAPPAGAPVEPAPQPADAAPAAGSPGGESLPAIVAEAGVIADPVTPGGSAVESSAATEGSGVTPTVPAEPVIGSMPVEPAGGAAATSAAAGTGGSDEAAVASATAATIAEQSPPGPPEDYESFPRLPDPRDPTTEGAGRVLTVGRWATALVSVGLVLLLGRVAQLQLRPPAGIARMVGNQRSRTILEPDRGMIADRNGRVFAATEFHQKLFVDPKMIRDPGTYSERVGYGLGYDPAKIEQLLHRRPNSRYVVIDPLLSPERQAQMKGLNLEGLGVDPLPAREYPMGQLAGQLIGFVGKEDHGLAGLERVLNPSLKGVPGQITAIRDASRRTIWIDQAQYRPPVDGQNIRLTIDAVIQQYAEEALGDACKQFSGETGEMIVMQPNTGQVLAMANYPPFNPENFATARRDVMENHCVTVTVEPGSTFKPFIWSRITSLGLMHPGQIVPTGGGVWLAPGGRRLHDAASHGSITWDQVLVLSSNIGMAQGAEHMQPQQLYDAVRAFGFGSKTGSDLPGEVRGQVHPLKNWTAYSMSSLPMGQEIAVTPLQLARAFSAIANGGAMLRPLILMSDAENLPVRGYVALDPDTAAHTREVLRRVVTEGTGRKADSPVYTIFGKTGTAQVADHAHGGYLEGKYTASFMGGAPLDNPQVVVVCIVHNPDKSKGHFGGTVAAPAVREVIEKTLSYLGVPPDRVHDQENASPAGPRGGHARMASAAE